MKTILHWFLSALAVGITAYLLPGVSLASWWTALVLAVVLGVVNTFLRPLLIILTLPLSIITLGLFTFVINALLILLAALIVPGFAISGFWTALLFSLVLAAVSFVLHKIGA